MINVISTRKDLINAELMVLSSEILSVFESDEAIKAVIPLLQQAECRWRGNASFLFDWKFKKDVCGFAGGKSQTK